jgi:serine/threonine protein kinase
MLARRPAFEGKTPAETVAAILRDQPAKLTGTGRDIPARVAALVGRCVEKNPQQRFQSARDLAFSLRDALNAAEARPSSPASGSIGRRDF